MLQLLDKKFFLRSQRVLFTTETAYDTFLYNKDDDIRRVGKIK